MAPPETKSKSNPKRTMVRIFEECMTTERKLSFQGPDNIRADSRYAISEIGGDYVIFQLLGDDQLVVPFSSISSLRVTPTALSVRYR